MLCRDIAGDAAFVNEVRSHRNKPWINDLIVPYALQGSKHAPTSVHVLARALRQVRRQLGGDRYMIFFSLACAVSVFAIVAKVRFLSNKLRSRFAREPAVHGKAYVSNASVVPVAADFAAAKALPKSKSTLKSQIEQSAFGRMRHVIAGLLALFEVWPSLAFADVAKLSLLSVTSLVHG